MNKPPVFAVVMIKDKLITQNLMPMMDFQT